MIWIKIAIILAMAGLNWARGYHWRPPCMIAMTVLMGAYFAILLHAWWLFPLVGLPMYGCLSLHDHNRGTWCSLVALGASFALLVTGHLAWYWFGFYCGFNFLLGWVTNNELKLSQLWEDLITGAGFGSLVFLI